jgi:hypothetical protein
MAINNFMTLVEYSPMEEEVTISPFKVSSTIVKSIKVTWALR